jgi:hypothetical protein
MYSSLIILSFISSFILQVAADLPLVRNSDGYQAGKYGETPRQKYYTSDIDAPLFQVNTFQPSRLDSSGHLLLSLKREDHAGPYIFSAEDLSLVYADPTMGATHNTMVQEYGGKKYLTYWGSTGSRYEGDCYMMDYRYRVSHKLSASGLNAKADMHDCKITKNGKAILTVYNPIKADLRMVGGKKDDDLIDSVFQVIDIATGKVELTWKASEHISPKESNIDYDKDPWRKPSGGPNENVGYNAYHINSVEQVRFPSSPSHFINLSTDPMTV